MSTLLAKARKSTRNMVTNRSSSLREASLHEPSHAHYDEESHAEDQVLPSNTTDSTAPNSLLQSTAKRGSGRPKIIKRQSSKQIMARRSNSTLEDYQLDPWDEDNLDAFPPELHYKQSYAPLSSLFCLVQTVILGVMMIQCGVAPMNINP